MLDTLSRCLSKQDNSVLLRRPIQQICTSRTVS